MLIITMRIIIAMFAYIAVKLYLYYRETTKADAIDESHYHPTKNENYTKDGDIDE